MTKKNLMNLQWAMVNVGAFGAWFFERDLLSERWVAWAALGGALVFVNLMFWVGTRWRRARERRKSAATSRG
jgi:hypothetical protein